MPNSDGLRRLWLELLPKSDQRKFMKSTSIDTGAIACLGIIIAVRPVQSVRVSLIGKGGSITDEFSPNTKLSTRHKNAKAESVNNEMGVKRRAKK